MKHSSIQISETSKGIILLICSAFCFALMAVFVRLAGDIHFMQKAFFRNFVAFFIALISTIIDVRKNGKASVAVPKAAWIYLILRSLGGSFGILGNFYAVDRLVLSDAAILNKMAPFFAILFSFILIKEKIKPIPLVAICVAFAGSLLIVKPSFNFSQMIPTLAGFAGGMGAGFAYSCVRKLGILGCKGKIVVLFFSAFSVLLTLPYMIFCFNPMTLLQWIYLICAGICAAGGQFSITSAYYHASASRISIYDYTQIIFSTLMGFIFFGQLPDYLSVIGYVIIISMAVLNFIYNRRIVEKKDMKEEKAEASTSSSEIQQCHEDLDTSVTLTDSTIKQ